MVIVLVEPFGHARKSLELTGVSHSQLVYFTATLWFAFLLSSLMVPSAIDDKTLGGKYDFHIVLEL